jgi:hypothetical protein
MEKLISGTYTTVAEGVTDDSGSAVFYLNPNTFYRMTFSKSGYSTETVTLRPIQSQYEIVLDSTITVAYNNTWDGVIVLLHPTKNVFSYTDNITFIYNITDYYSSLSSFTVNITNGTNILFFGNSSNSAGGKLNYSVWNLAPYSNTTLTMTAKFTRHGFPTATLTRNFTITLYSPGNYTLYDGLVRLSRGEGMDKGTATLIALVIIAIMMTGAGLVVGTVGAGTVGLIGLVIAGYIGSLDWGFLGFVAILIVAIMILKERL